MQLFKVLLAIGGSDHMVIPPADRGWGQGVVSGPEVEVLRMCHGAGTVREITPFDFEEGAVETTTKREKARLMRLYPGDKVEQVFPGVNPQMTLQPSLDEIMDEGNSEPEDGEDDAPKPKRRAKAPPSPQKVLEQQTGKG
jgi:hypothetical protein